MRIKQSILQKNINMFTKQVIKDLDVNIESCINVIGFHEIESEACVDGGIVYVYSEMEVDGFLNDNGVGHYWSDTKVTSFEVIEGHFVNNDNGSERQLTKNEILLLNEKLA